MDIYKDLRLKAPYFPAFIMEIRQLPEPKKREVALVFASNIRVKEEGNHGLWKDKLCLQEFIVGILYNERHYTIAFLEECYRNLMLGKAMDGYDTISSFQGNESMRLNLKLKKLIK